MTDRCRSTRLSGAHCSLEVGHTGAHLEFSPNGVTGWEQAEPVTSWRAAADRVDSDIT